MAEQNNPTTDLKIITININGGVMEKLKDKKAFLNKYHVIMLQETHLRKDSNGGGVLQQDCQDLGLDARSQRYMTNFSSNKRGVGIIINTEHEFTHRFYDEGNYIGVCAKIRGHKYIFVSFYYHSQETEALLCRFLEDIKGKHGIRVIGGDFNVAIDSELDIVNDNGNHPERRRTFMSIWPYEDVFRAKNKGSKQKTFQDKSRLDYFFMKEEDLELVNDCQILPKQEFTDHCPVELSLKAPEDRGNEDEEEKPVKKKDVDDLEKNLGNMKISKQKNK